MALIVTIGPKGIVNEKLLQKAAISKALVIDCSNSASQRALTQSLPSELLGDVRVLGVELYELRDVLEMIIEQDLPPQAIIVTPFDWPSSHHDENGNSELYEHIWQLIVELSQKHSLVVGVRRGSGQEELARKHIHRKPEVMSEKMALGIC